MHSKSKTPNREGNCQFYSVIKYDSNPTVKTTSLTIIQQWFISAVFMSGAFEDHLQDLHWFQASVDPYFTWCFRYFGIPSKKRFSQNNFTWINHSRHLPDGYHFMTLLCRRKGYVPLYVEAALENATVSRTQYDA